MRLFLIFPTTVCSYFPSSIVYRAYLFLCLLYEPKTISTTHIHHYSAPYKSSTVSGDFLSSSYSSPLPSLRPSPSQGVPSTIALECEADGLEDDVLSPASFDLSCRPPSSRRFLSPLPLLPPRLLLPPALFPTSLPLPAAWITIAGRDNYCWKGWKGVF